MKLSHIDGILSWEGKGLTVASCPLGNPEGSQGQSSWPELDGSSPPAVGRGAFLHRNAAVLMSSTPVVMPYICTF